MGVKGDSDVPKHASLERLRDQTFHFSLYSERQFHDTHYHCKSCRKRIAEGTDLSSEHEGYVNLNSVQYKGFPPSYQYSWLCKDCFPKLRDAFGWKLSTGQPPAIPREAHLAFTLAYREYLGKQVKKPVQQNNSETQYASVAWTPSDVVGVARTVGVKMTEKAAAELLLLNENHIRGEMTGHAVQLIRELIGLRVERVKRETGKRGRGKQKKTGGKTGTA